MQSIHSIIYKPSLEGIALSLIMRQPHRTSQPKIRRTCIGSLCILLLLLAPVTPNAYVTSFGNPVNCWKTRRRTLPITNLTAGSRALFPIRKHQPVWTIRGGSISPRALLSIKRSAGDKRDDEKEETTYTFQQRGMSIALAATYFSVMGAKCALPAVLSLLTSTTTGLTFPEGEVEPQQLVASVLATATVGIAVGKLLLGPIIDRCGGVLSLQVALSTLAVLMGLIAACQSFQMFAITWICVDFIFSSCWAACINAIHQSFPQSMWAGQIGVLASAARTGNAAAFALFAWILHAFQPRMRQPWRPVFAIASISQVLPVILLTYFRPKKLGEDQPTKDQPSIRASLGILRREIGCIDFWLHLVNRSVLMVFASFLLFVPTLLHQVYQTSSSAASQVAAVYALGCLLSLTFGSQAFAKLSTRKSKLATLSVVLGAAIASSLGQLGHVSGWWVLSPATSAISLFMWGMSFAIPFYLPPSLYALAKGGKQSSATVSDEVELWGFSVLSKTHHTLLLHSQ